MDYISPLPVVLIDARTVDPHRMMGGAL
jgi:hypothetical protein